MFVAEIRRKMLDIDDIDPEDSDVFEQIRAILRETKEDLLTSDVFGALKYLPRLPYLEAVLHAIVKRNPDILKSGYPVYSTIYHMLCFATYNHFAWHGATIYGLFDQTVEE